MQIREDIVKDIFAKAKKKSPQPFTYQGYLTAYEIGWLQERDCTVSLFNFNGNGTYAYSVNYTKKKKSN